MRVLNVSERMKEAPAHALRAVFAGIGQALLVSDRVRRRFRDGEQEPHAEPVTSPPPATVPPATAEATAPAPAAAKPAPTPAPGPAAAPRPSAPPSPPSGAEPAPSGAEPAPSGAAPAPSGPTAPSAVDRGTESGTASAPEPPLPNYDELSIASLRARMRGLDVSQLRNLIMYEKAHAARDDVIAMFERRITKLEETGS
jgi:hypothetical protein